MLARNFKTAKSLGITDQEISALIKVLGMLERGDLRDVDQDESCNNGFNMGTQGFGCGTPACIGGWVATIMDVPQMMYVDDYMESRRKPAGITSLYWGTLDASVQEAALALRNFLTEGHPRWSSVFADTRSPQGSETPHD